MSSTFTAVNGYDIMWLIVCFDIPVKTKTMQRYANQFRKNLKKDGFEMMQYSVYIRPCGSGESADMHTTRIKTFLPPLGLVSILRITDKQFGQITTLMGKRQPKPQPPPPQQLEFF